RVGTLTPALRAGTPPPLGSYARRLPRGPGARFGAPPQAAAPSSPPTWIVHRITRNQTLAEIARLYRVTTQRLVDLNHLPGGRLRGIRELVVPAVTPSVAVAAAAPAPPARAPRAGGLPQRHPPS